MPEELGLGFEGVLHGLVALNILLRPVHDTDPAQLQGIDATGHDVQSIRTMIHEINLGEHTDGPPSQGVDMAGELQGFGIDDVYVGRGHGQNYAVRFRNVL